MNTCPTCGYQAPTTPHYRMGDTIRRLENGDVGHVIRVDNLDSTVNIRWCNGEQKWLAQDKITQDTPAAEFAVGDKIRYVCHHPHFQEGRMAIGTEGHVRDMMGSVAYVDFGYCSKWVFLSSLWKLEMPATDDVPPPQYPVGTVLDVLDNCQNWYVSMVCEEKGTDVRIHYEGWEDSYDEWIALTSARLAPLSTHTVAGYVIGDRVRCIQGNDRVLEEETGEIIGLGFDDMRVRWDAKWVQRIDADCVEKITTPALAESTTPPPCPYKGGDIVRVSKPIRPVPVASETSGAWEDSGT